MSVPVIQCDTCRRVTPARLRPGLRRPELNEEQRAADLRSEGWVLGPDGDSCPICARETQGQSG